jgi:hypothetical protein
MMVSPTQLYASVLTIDDASAGMTEDVAITMPKISFFMSFFGDW